MSIDIDRSGGIIDPYALTTKSDLEIPEGWGGQKPRKIQRRGGVNG